VALGGFVVFPLLPPLAMNFPQPGYRPFPPGDPSMVGQGFPQMAPMGPLHGGDGGPRQQQQLPPMMPMLGGSGGAASEGLPMLPPMNVLSGGMGDGREESGMGQFAPMHHPMPMLPPGADPRQFAPGLLGPQHHHLPGQEGMMMPPGMPPPMMYASADPSLHRSGGMPPHEAMSAASGDLGGAAHTSRPPKAVAPRKSKKRRAEGDATRLKKRHKKKKEKRGRKSKADRKDKDSPLQTDRRKLRTPDPVPPAAPAAPEPPVPEILDPSQPGFNPRFVDMEKIRRSEPESEAAEGEDTAPALPPGSKLRMLLAAQRSDTAALGLVDNRAREMLKAGGFPFVPDTEGGVTAEVGGALHLTPSEVTFFTLAREQYDTMCLVRDAARGKKLRTDRISQLRETEEVQLEAIDHLRSKIATANYRLMEARATNFGEVASNFRVLSKWLESCN
jgi:hypothetical protein